MLWEPEHGGAQNAAFDIGARLYWNAPTREDDIDGQIALVQRISEENYQGLVLAPDQSHALITPVRRAIERGLSVVIVGSSLPIPPNDKLAYILNDEEEGGRLAGERLATILHGQGSVALLGIDGDIAGILVRARSLEQFLTTHYPNIRVVKKLGSFNVPHEQQVAAETFKENPDLDAVVTLTSTSMVGVFSALASMGPVHHIKIIAFDADSTLGFDSPNLDSVVMEDTRKMGAAAVRLIAAKLHGETAPSITRLEPVLVLRENLNRAEMLQITSRYWRPEPIERPWRAPQ
jgi:ribose transport system substrate-binding protein